MAPRFPLVLAVLLPLACAEVPLSLPEAKRVYDRAPEQSPEEAVADAEARHAAHRAAAEGALAEERHEDAVLELRRALAVREDPETRELLAAAERRAEAAELVTVAMHDEEQGALRIARESYRGALSLDPENATAREGAERVGALLDRADSLALRAAEALDAGQIETAELFAREALDLDPEHAEARRVLRSADREFTARAAETDAEAARAAGELARAVELTRAASDIAPTPEREARLAAWSEEAVAHYTELGDVALAAERWDQAVAAYRQAEELAPEDFALDTRLVSAEQRLALQLALEAQKHGDAEAAAQHARRALRLEEDLYERKRLIALAKEEERESATAAGAPARSSAEVWDARRGSLVLVDSGAVTALGVMIEPGVILTHRHTLDGSQGTLRSWSGSESTFDRVVLHREVDLALVFAEDLDAEVAPVGAGLELRRGERVSLVGGRGRQLGYEDGAVLHIGRIGSTGRTQFIQFSGASETRGGGPLFDDRGRLVGLALPLFMGGSSALRVALPVEYGLELVGY